MEKKKRKSSLDEAIKKAWNELPEEKRKEMEEVLKNMPPTERWHFEHTGIRGSAVQCCTKFGQGLPQEGARAKVYRLKVDKTKKGKSRKSKTEKNQAKKTGD